MVTEAETIEVYRHTCGRCAHVWRSDLNKPVVCPKCKSPYWDKPRKSK